MLKNNTINIKVLEKLARALEELNEEVIYIGGAVVSLYITDIAAEQPRPTKDIDLSVQISSYNEMEELRKRLASKKIYPAINETVIYRYTLDDLLIDFIPLKETVLGPTNSWLKFAYAKAIKIKLETETIKILPLNLFLATKWEAYKSRGNNDPRLSHDFEDIIYVIDNSLDLVDEVKSSESKLRLFLQAMAKEILEHPVRVEILECHINPFTSAERIAILIEKLEQLIEI